MKEFVGKLGSFLLDTLQTIVLALSIFVISYLFLFQPHQVRGSSMYPNFENDDFLLTDKISYHFRDPKRGEVIVFKAPPSEPCAEEECEYIKRIIALPGDRLQIQDDSYFINGQKLLESYLSQTVKTEPGSFLSMGKTIVLDEDEYFVSGDNRPYSHDSRAFGLIKKNALIGRAWVRYWPPPKFGLLPQAQF